VTQRDEGLRRITQLTSLLGFVAVALIGALAGYVAQAKPGRSTTTPTRHSANTLAAVTSPEEAGVGSEEAGAALAPPSEPPLPATESPQVVSGGS
jgi:uncharacterized membrane protein